MRFKKSENGDSFFDLLATQAKLMVRGAELLARIPGEQHEGRVALRNELHDVEHACDEATHAVINKLNQTFVTPFDRDDIAYIAGRLDDCMDYMDEAGDLIVLYQVNELPAGIHQQLNVIQRCCDLTAEAMPRLETLESLRDYWVEINRLENEGDKAYRHTLAQIFNSDMDPLEVIKIKDIIACLEKAVDSFESLANGVETIAIKES